jgi:hypothetical protein
MWALLRPPRQQTAVINAIRAHLAELGIVAPVGRSPAPNSKECHRDCDHLIVRRYIVPDGNFVRIALRGNKTEIDEGSLCA